MSNFRQYDLRRGVLLSGAYLKNPITAPQGTVASKFAGRTAVASGTASVTVSCTTINSDSILVLTPEASTRVASGFARQMEVSSIVSGVSFAIATADGIANARDTTVHWMIIRGS